MTTFNLLDHFAALEDPRQSWKTLYPLDEILLIVLGGEMAGADDLVEIALWGPAQAGLAAAVLAVRDTGCHRITHSMT